MLVTFSNQISEGSCWSLTSLYNSTATFDAKFNSSDQGDHFAKL
jgi:hypothetical protein